MKALLDFLNGNRVFFYANLAVAFLLLNAISAGSGCRLDLTRDRVHSLSDSTEQVLSRVDQPILIEAYISEDAPPELHSGIRPIVNVLEAIGRVGGDRDLSGSRIGPQAQVHAKDIAVDRRLIQKLDQPLHDIDGRAALVAAFLERKAVMIIEDDQIDIG